MAPRWGKQLTAQSDIRAHQAGESLPSESSTTPRPNIPASSPEGLGRSHKADEAASLRTTSQVQGPPTPLQAESRAGQGPQAQPPQATSESLLSWGQVPEYLVNDVQAPAPRMKLEARKIHVNLMVCGMTGLGKTTCIQNMLAAYFPGQSIRPHDGTSTSFKAFAKHPDQLLVTTKEVEVPDSGLQVIYTIQDTPGWGDQLEIQNNIETVIDHVKHRKALEMEKWHGEHYEENRVEYVHMLDACLYFIPPHRFNNIDKDFIRRLAKEVTVIPVIAKADSMTVQETKNFKEEIKAILEDPSDGIPQYNFEGKIDEINADRPALGPMPPFAIVGSLQSTDGGKWPTRTYPWGECESWNPDHSDFCWLKQLLLVAGTAGLRTRRHNFYVKHVICTTAG
ncbi:hypothetical protein WJX72_005192 [[Myrmecia] bisecta]|uniref:Septin-type G domain-containing protein n=1 Tax=[Myrmecia] bisecta TaxID=41462 RepID=A0AAW1P6V6_9CHLO